MKILEPLPAQDVYTGGSPDDTKSYMLPWWTFENVQAMEDQSIQGYAAFVMDHDPRFEANAACKALSGVEVEIRTEPYWNDPGNGGEAVTGLTHCAGEVTPWIEMGGDHAPNSGTLTHEMAHAIQRCSPIGPFPMANTDPTYENDGDPQHENWGRDGIYSAIAFVQSDHSNQIAQRDSIIFDCDEDAGCAYAGARDAGLP
jgi:hypothetical protein